MSTGRRILEGAKEALAIARGEASPAVVHTLSTPDVAAIRKRLGLSQTKFAEKFGIPAATIRDWEQGRRIPDNPARNLLKVIDYAPETVARAIGEHHTV